MSRCILINKRGKKGVWFQTPGNNQTLAIVARLKIHHCLALLSLGIYVVISELDVHSAKEEGQCCQSKSK